MFIFLFITCLLDEVRLLVDTQCVKLSYFPCMDNCRFIQTYSISNSAQIEMEE